MSEALKRIEEKHKRCRAGMAPSLRKKAADEEVAR